MNKLFRYFFFVLIPVLSVLVVSCDEIEEPIPEPQITSINPAAGIPGSMVAIVGLNIEDASAVTFGSTSATIISDTAKNIIYTNVPEGLPAEGLMVTVEAPGGFYSYPFAVLDPAVAATFTAIEPATGPVGTEVTIKGTNFTDASSLKVGNTEILNFEVNEAGNSITFIVPQSAFKEPFSGPFTITTPAGTFYSAPDFVFTLEESPNVSVVLSAEVPNVLSGFGGTVVLNAELLGNEEDVATISKVVFFEGETELATVTAAPFVHEFVVAEDVEPYTNFRITAEAYGDQGNVLESEVFFVRVGERIPISGGTLTGDGNERWNTDGPTEAPFPSDGKYPGFLNFDGAGDLEAASGVNLPVSVPEDGKYLVALGLASGWADAESFMWVYFNDQVAKAQRSAEVPPTGWIDFHTYLIPNPFQLPAGEHIAKIRFGGPFVHPYYLDLYKF